MIISDRVFENYTYVMAIINLTPDSFYKESRVMYDDVLFRAKKAISEGAAIIDLGAQSTRPGYREVPPEEEMARLEKPLYELKRHFDIPVSVDTYFPEVAHFAFQLGADMLNDVWGLSRSGMAEEAAKAGASVCIMHNSKTPLTGDIMPTISDFLKGAALKAEQAGIPHEKICIDGGIGFAKDREQSLELLQRYGELSALGYPLLLGASRKSLFGGTVEDRLQATINSTRMAARQGVLFVRVHDVKANVIAIKEEYERN